MVSCCVDEVTDQPEWWHYMIVIVPDELTYTDTAFIMVDNGNLGDP